MDIEVVNARDGASLKLEFSEGEVSDPLFRIVEEYWGERSGTYLLRNGTDIIPPGTRLMSGETYYVVPSP